MIMQRIFLIVTVFSFVGALLTAGNCQKKMTVTPGQQPILPYTPVHCVEQPAESSVESTPVAGTPSSIYEGSPAPEGSPIRVLENIDDSDIWRMWLDCVVADADACRGDRYVDLSESTDLTVDDIQYLRANSNKPERIIFPSEVGLYK